MTDRAPNEYEEILSNDPLLIERLAAARPPDAGPDVVAFLVLAAVLVLIVVATALLLLRRWHAGWRPRLSRSGRAVVAAWLIWMGTVFGYHFVFEYGGFVPFFEEPEFWRLMLIPPAIATGALLVIRWVWAAPSGR